MLSVFGFATPQLVKAPRNAILVQEDKGRARSGVFANSAFARIGILQFPVQAPEHQKRARDRSARRGIYTVVEDLQADQV